MLQRCEQIMRDVCTYRRNVKIIGLSVDPVDSHVVWAGDRGPADGTGDACLDLKAEGSADQANGKSLQACRLAR